MHRSKKGVSAAAPTVRSPRIKAQASQAPKAASQHKSTRPKQPADTVSKPSSKAARKPKPAVQKPQRVETKAEDRARSETQAAEPSGEVNSASNVCISTASRQQPERRDSEPIPGAAEEEDSPVRGEEEHLGADIDTRSDLLNEEVNGRRLSGGVKDWEAPMNEGSTPEGWREADR